MASPAVQCLVPTDGSKPDRPAVGEKPWGEAIHGTAVAIGDAGLIILGPSGAGKSRLAAALIAASSARQPIMLVGDDRILISRAAGALVARPHPRIAGFIERRGFGIVACPHVAVSVVCGVVCFDGTTTLSASGGQNFPGLPLVTVEQTLAPDVQRDIVLRWWRDACTTPASKATPRLADGAKD